MDGPIIKLLIVGEPSFSHSSLHFILKHCCFVLGGLGGDAHLGLVTQGCNLHEREAFPISFTSVFPLHAVVLWIIVSSGIFVE